MLKDPGIVKGTTAHGNTVASGPLHHVSGRLGRGHISIANDRDLLDSPHHLGNSLQIDDSTEPLLPGSSVHKNSGNPSILKRLSQIGSSDISFIPAQTHFGSHRNTQGVHHGLHQCGSFLPFSHHGRPPTHFDDLAHRTPHVDVNRGNAPFLKHKGCITHLLGHRTKKLH